MFGVFRVKNHDFTPKNHMFSNFRRGRLPLGSAPDSPTISAPMSITHTSKVKMATSLQMTKALFFPNLVYDPELTTLVQQCVRIVGYKEL